MLKRNLTSFAVAISMLLSASCAFSGQPSVSPSAPMDGANNYSELSFKTPIDGYYYFDDNTDTLIYFEKNADSGGFDSIFAPDNQEKEKYSPFPQFRSHIFLMTDIFIFTVHTLLCIIPVLLNRKSIRNIKTS